MRKADGKCRRAIMSPVSHLWTCTLDGEFAGDGERVWARRLTKQNLLLTKKN